MSVAHMTLNYALSPDARVGGDGVCLLIVPRRFHGGHGAPRMSRAGPPGTHEHAVVTARILEQLVDGASSSGVNVPWSTRPGDEYRLTEKGIAPVACDRHRDEMGPTAHLTRIGPPL